MATIADLPNKSILTMSWGELIDHIQAVRVRRREKKRKVVKSKPMPKADKLVDKMSDDQAAQLLRLLEGRT